VNLVVCRQGVEYGEHVLGGAPALDFFFCCGADVDDIDVQA